MDTKYCNKTMVGKMKQSSSTEPENGQWRNDVFNERGAIVNCSGDICDGLWINGYPAAILDLHWLIYQSLRETEPESGSDTHMEQEMLRAASVKGGKKPSGKISAEKAEKITVSQEKMEDSRSHMTYKELKLQKDQNLMKNSKTLQSQYVLMVHEVTVPPFLGQTLTPAFKHFRFFQRISKPRTKILSKPPASKKAQTPHSGRVLRAH